MEHNYEVKTSNRFLMVATGSQRTSEACLLVGSGELSLVSSYILYWSQQVNENGERVWSVELQ